MVGLGASAGAGATRRLLKFAIAKNDESNRNLDGLRDVARGVMNSVGILNQQSREQDGITVNMNDISQHQASALEQIGLPRGARREFGIHQQDRQVPLRGAGDHGCLGERPQGRQRPGPGQLDRDQRDPQRGGGFLEQVGVPHPAHQGQVPDAEDQEHGDVELRPGDQRHRRPGEPAQPQRRHRGGPGRGIAGAASPSSPTKFPSSPTRPRRTPRRSGKSSRTTRRSSTRAAARSPSPRK